MARAEPLDPSRCPCVNMMVAPDVRQCVFAPDHGGVCRTEGGHEFPGQEQLARWAEYSNRQSVPSGHPQIGDLTLPGYVANLRRAQREHDLAQAAYRAMVPKDGSGLRSSMKAIEKAEAKLAEAGRERDEWQRRLIAACMEMYPE